MQGKEIINAVVLVMIVVLLAVISGLIIGSVLGVDAFSSLTIINTTYLEAQFGSFVTALVVFLPLIGTVIAIVWLVFYFKQLFDKDKGLQGITA